MHPEVVDGKTLAEEMAEQDEKLQEAMDVQEVHKESSEAEIAEEPTIDNIEQFLIDEGQWLEGQIAADTGAYKNCPVCSLMPDIFHAFTEGLQETLEALDKMREAGVDEAMILEFLKTDRAWYLVAKQASLRLHEEGHAPRNVINAHPELHSLGAAKKKRSAGNSKKKNKRKAAKAARRNNR